MRILALILSCFTLTGACLADSPQPNIIFILADDLGYGDSI
jgi:hypothetical protein